MAVIIEAADTDSSFLIRIFALKTILSKGENYECGICIGNACDVVLKNNRFLDCENGYITHSTINIIINK